MKSQHVWIKWIFGTLLAIALWASVQVLGFEQRRRSIHEDVIELSNIKYGLFNVDEWKAIASHIIAKKIDEFDLRPAERIEMKRKIVALLTEVIAELKDRFQQENKKGLMGFIRREGVSFFGIFDQMERDIPAFAEQMLQFLEDPQNRKDLKNFLNEKVDRYADETFSETDYSLYNAILLRHSAADKSEALDITAVEANNLKMQILPWTRLIYALILVAIAYLLVGMHYCKWTISFIIGIGLCGLYLGVMLPMIEIDARIDRLSFVLLNEQVVFTDQVLFFKSKSILEVVQLMAEQGKADLMAVAALVLVFSVLFPLSKMSAGMVWLHSRKYRKSKFLNFLVFKTGKWSMADVMVVAIFMAFIGFQGILSEQLRQLEGLTAHADVLTTNQSTLQSGFYMFTAFVVLSLCISQRMSHREDPIPT